MSARSSGVSPQGLGLSGRQLIIFHSFINGRACGEFGWFGSGVSVVGLRV